ncbi:VOC family protein [Streptomyces sp. NPDC001142]
MSARISTGSAGLNVTDVERSADFYAAALGFEVVRRSPDGAEHEWALLGVAGVVLLTLWQQAESGFAPASAGMHHLSFEIGSMAELSALEQRVRAAGARMREGPRGVEDLSSRRQFFFFDPDGIRLELYTEEEPANPAPTRDLPMCGFYEELAP